MSDTLTAIDLLRHALATIRYRGDIALLDAPEDFGEFEIGSEVWTPNKIVSHISDVLTYATKMADPMMTHLPPGKDSSFQAQINRFHRTLNQLDHIISTKEEITTDLVKPLYQGPIADALTHIGQLAMLRRCAGSPVTPENYIKADVPPLNPGGA